MFWILVFCALVAAAIMTAIIFYHPIHDNSLQRIGMSGLVIALIAVANRGISLGAFHSLDAMLILFGALTAIGTGWECFRRKKGRRRYD